MKTLFIIIITIMSTTLFSQNNAITGSYHQSSGNPEGGTTFIVLPNGTFVVGYFGGVRKGTWELKENDLYEFTYHVESKFVLYGRHNATFKDSVSVNMALDASQKPSVRFNNIKNESFTAVFNANANCFSYPYIYKQKEKLNHLEAYISDNSSYYEADKKDSLSIYSFKIEEDYNEFLLTGLSEEYSQGGSFIAKYKDGILSLDESSNLKKSRNYEDLSEETLNFAKEYAAKEILPQVLNYGNEFFPYYENPTASDLVPFTRIESRIKVSKTIKLSDQSLFIARCDD